MERDRRSGLAAGRSRNGSPDWATPAGGLRRAVVEVSVSPKPRVSSVRVPVHVHGLQGASVVIVDDHESARIALDEMIRDIDPSISTTLFPGGIEALAWLERHEPDLVITDYRMPGMTGAQFTRALRKSRRLQHVPVMVVTASDDRAVRYASLEAGAVDFLAKPLDPLEVRTRCRNLLLLMHHYRLVRKHSLLQDGKLDRLQGLLRSRPRAPTQGVAQRSEQDELVTVAYEKLFAVTSCLAGIQELFAVAQRNIADLEEQLARPLRGSKN